MKSRIIFKNVITSGGQIVVIGIVYFILYKFLLKEVGVSLLGVWSVVMSASSIGNLANLGISTSMVRFVALYRQDNKLKEIPSLIFTGALFMSGLFALICIIIWPLSDFLLGKVVESAYIPTAKSLLPFSLICFIINSLSGVYGSVLDGLQKNYIRSYIFSFSSLILLGVTICLTRKYGIYAVVIGQIVQSIFSFLACLFVSIFYIKYNPVKWRWNNTIFKEIFAYGIKFQLTSITGMLNEPVTKMFMARFGGMEFTGYFEMANKLIMQVRGVIVNANQSLIPLLIKGKSSVSERLSKSNIVYRLSFAVVFVLSLLLLAGSTLMADLISVVWLGHHEIIFVNILFLLALSTFFNMISVPTYFSLLAIGDLKPIIISQSIMALLNVFFGLILGYFFGGYGVVIAWFAVVMIGSFYLIKCFDFPSSLVYLKMFRKHIIILIFITLLFIVSKILLYRKYNSFNLDVILLTAYILYFIVSSYLFYLNTIKKNNFSFNETMRNSSRL